MSRTKRIRWYIAADEYLLLQTKNRNIRIWRPKIVRVVLKNGVWVNSDEFAFMGYSFVGSVHGWEYIKKHMPSIIFICKNGIPYELSPTDISSIKIFDGVQFNVFPAKFRVGHLVRVARKCSSAFAGLDGVVLKSVPVIGGEQVCVGFCLDGVEFRECIPLDHLEFIDERKV